jgi:hypothetical protein
MTLVRFAALLGLALAATPRLQVSNGNPEACARYAKIEPPAADLPTDADRQQLNGCDSERLYFGFDKAPDMVEARTCALLQWQGATIEQGKHFDSSSILTMIYANGRGAPRNVDVALKFACEVGGAPAENSGRVEHLERLKKQRSTGTNFHICDDITSGAMMGICAAFRQEFDRAVRQRRRDRLLLHR